MRLPRHEPTSVCRKCEIDKPCTRCGKVSYVIGKNTDYGPVSNACSPHFRAAEPCEVCGKLSSRLVRVAHLGRARVCHRCYRSDARSCNACGRHRRLHESSDGRMLCKICSEKGEIFCPSCHKLMPAGYGKQCGTCYWESLLEKRIRMDGAAFTSPHMATQFELFGKWLGSEVGVHKAAITVHRYLKFFMEVEERWECIPAYAELLAYFGTARLRRVLLPMRWMEKTGRIVPDKQAKANDSESRRISTIMSKVAKGTRQWVILDGYRETLIGDWRAGKMRLSSVRLALSPAATLLCQAVESDCMPPDQSIFDVYLSKTPGQRASLFRFARYLNDKCSTKITLPRPDLKKAERLRRKKLEVELVALMRDPTDSDALSRRWLSAAMAYFHGLPKRVVGADWKIKLKQSGQDEGAIFQWNGQEYWFPLRSHDSNVVFLSHERG